MLWCSPLSRYSRFTVQMQPEVLRAETGLLPGHRSYPTPAPAHSCCGSFGHKARTDITHHWHLQRSFGSPNTPDSARIGGETGSFSRRFAHLPFLRSSFAPRRSRARPPPFAAALLAAAATLILVAQPLIAGPSAMALSWFANWLDDFCDRHRVGLNDGYRVQQTRALFSG